MRPLTNKELANFAEHRRKAKAKLPASTRHAKFYELLESNPEMALERAATIDQLALAQEHQAKQNSRKTAA